MIYLALKLCKVYGWVGTTQNSCDVPSLNSFWKCINLQCLGLIMMINSDAYYKYKNILFSYDTPLSTATTSSPGRIEFKLLNMCYSTCKALLKKFTVAMEFTPS